jgi:hypothetical protein
MAQRYDRDRYALRPIVQFRADGKGIRAQNERRNDVAPLQRLSVRRIEIAQLISKGKPDVLSVTSDTAHVLNAQKRSKFTDDFDR